jgi:hypothetical protein
MNVPAFEEIKETIENRLDQTYEILGELEYEYLECSAKEFYDYITGETFTSDRTTFRDILGNEYLMLHETVEISELKKSGINIKKNTIMEGDRTTIFTCHFYAMGFELDYALLLEDFYWLKHRLGYHETLVNTQLNLPSRLKDRGIEIHNAYSKFKNY